MNRREFLHRSTAAFAAATAARGASAQTKTSLRLALAGDVILSRRGSMLAGPAFLEAAARLQYAVCACGNR